MLNMPFLREQHKNHVFQEITEILNNKKIQNQTDIHPIIFYIYLFHFFLRILLTLYDNYKTKRRLLFGNTTPNKQGRRERTMED